MIRLSSDQIVNVLENACAGTIGMQGWQHPLGFLHVRIHTKLEHKLRLHIWPKALPGSILGTKHRVHNHAFDFVSHVLWGNIVERRYNLALATEGDHATWEVLQGSGQSVLRRTRLRCELEYRGEYCHSAGEIYQMEAGNFHDAIGNVDGTATILLARPQPQIKALVVSRRYDTIKAHDLWSCVDTAPLRATVRNLVNRLA